jgi:adenosylhomocysteine nucleosidase
VPGIVAALEMESRWIRTPVHPVEVSGVGAGRAEAAAHRLLDRGVSALVSWGVAGGLDPGLSPGTVVLPDAVIGLDGTPAEVDTAWRDRLLSRIRHQVDTSTLSVVHASEPVASPLEKADLRRRTWAGAVDMESSAVAAVAIEAGVPFIIVRVVVDSADVRLPRAALQMCDRRGRLKRSAVLRLIVMPGEWLGMMKLGRANGAAARSMRRVWSIAEPDLALSHESS